MAEDTVQRVPQPFGGISKQPPQLRHPSQVEQADNVLLSIADGAQKRPGTKFVGAVEGLSDGDYRLHAMNRDNSEKYLVIYGEGSIRILDDAGNDYPLKTDANALAYFQAEEATAADIRMTTIADYTIIVNTRVETDSKTATEYVVSDELYNYDAMLSTYPALLTYHRTRNETIAQTPGFWQFTPGTTNTPGVWQGRVHHSKTLVSQYQNTARNPGGFSLGWGRQLLPDGSYDWDHTAGTLTSTGAFKSYTYSMHDYLWVSGTTGIDDGWYKVTGKTDDDTITFDADDLANTDKTVTTPIYAGQVVEVKIDFTNVPATATMFDVALRFQDAIRDATGESRFLCSWTYVFDNSSDAQDGYMTITAPDDGVNSFVGQPFAPSSTLFNWAANGNTLDDGGDGSLPTITGGTGTNYSQSIDPKDRWTRVPPSGQAEAEPDETTMPIQLTRRFNPTGHGATYASSVAAQAFAHWRLGETSGTTANDSVGANDGTYTGGYTLGTTGLLTTDTDKAVTLNGTTGYIDVGTLGDWGSSLGDGFTFEAIFKTTSTARQTLYRQADGSGQIVSVTLNAGANGFASTGKIRAYLSDSAGNEIQFATLADTGLTDGNKHHLVIKFIPDQQRAEFWFDGVKKTPAWASTDVLGSFADFTTAGTLGFGATFYLDGVLDEVALYKTVLENEVIILHHERAIGTAWALSEIYFSLDLNEWNFRETGDPFSNPIPDLISKHRKISAVTFHRDRMVLAGDTNIAMSQVNDYFNLFISDAADISDADPINASPSSGQVTIITDLVEFRKTLVILTAAGKQFELATPDALTPSTVAITPSTAYKTLDVRPAQMGNFIYFATTQADGTHIREYFYNDSLANSDAADITGHCVGLIPQSTPVQTIIGSNNDNTIAVFCAGAPLVYIYRFYWVGPKKEQSAWARWTFDGDDTILDIAGINNDMFMLVKRDGTFAMLKVALGTEAAATDWPFPVHLDRQHTLTGEYDEEADLTTWTIPQADTAIDTIVTRDGTVLTAAGNSDVSVTAQGDRSAYPAVLGSAFNSIIQLSKQYRRDYNGQAETGSTMTIRRIVTSHRNTGDYGIRVTMPRRPERVKFFTAAEGTVEDVGTLQAFFNGNSKDIDIFIEAGQPRPAIITSVEIDADFTPRRG